MVSNWIICLKSWHWIGQLIWIARKIRPQGNYKPFTPSNSPDNDSLLKIKEVKVLFIVLSCPKCQFSSLLALSKKSSLKSNWAKNWFLFFFFLGLIDPAHAIRFDFEPNVHEYLGVRREDQIWKGRSDQKTYRESHSTWRQNTIKVIFLNNLEANEKTPSLSIFWNRPENCLSPKMTPGFFEPR